MDKIWIRSTEWWWAWSCRLTSIGTGRCSVATSSVPLGWWYWNCSLQGEETESGWAFETRALLGLLLFVKGSWGKTCCLPMNALCWCSQEECLKSDLDPDPKPRTQARCSLAGHLSYSQYQYQGCNPYSSILLILIWE